MKTALACGVLLLSVLLATGCASSNSSNPPSRTSSTGARCLSRPDTSGTQPLFYLLCIQTN